MKFIEKNNKEFAFSNQPDQVYQTLGLNNFQSVWSSNQASYRNSLNVLHNIRDPKIAEAIKKSKNKLNQSMEANVPATHSFTDDKGNIDIDKAFTLT